MYHTTGFIKAEITELCARIEARLFRQSPRCWYKRFSTTSPRPTLISSLMRFRGAKWVAGRGRLWATSGDDQYSSLALQAT
jgi:hypothetical protein